MFKHRKFPGKDNITEKKGLVCKICDRKFFMFATFSQYREKMEAQQEILSENEAIVEKKNQEYLAEKQNI